jgi:hypothetical protein
MPQTQDGRIWALWDRRGKEALSSKQRDNKRGEKERQGRRKQLQRAKARTDHGSTDERCGKEAWNQNLGGDGVEVALYISLEFSLLAYAGDKGILLSYGGVWTVLALHCTSSSN